MKKIKIIEIVFLLCCFSNCENKPEEGSKNVNSSKNIQGLTLTPTSTQIPLGITANFTATVTYGDGTSQDVTAEATWTSEDLSVVTIDDKGIAAGVVPGNTHIYATYKDTSSEKVLITVTEAELKSIDISADANSIPKGKTVTFTATGTYSDLSTGNISGSVTWTSSNPATVTLISSGIATGVFPGESQITASLGDIISSSLTLSVSQPVLTAITISPSQTDVQAGMTKIFTSIGTLSDGTTTTVRNLSWISSDVSVATITAVDANGLALGILPGKVLIRASINNIISNDAALTVLLPQVAPVANAGTDRNVAIGSQIQLDGSASSDANGDVITYTWSLVSTPSGSSASISDPSIVNPVFVPDFSGSYIFSLVVNDGIIDSAPVTVTFTAFPSCGSSSVVISQVYGGGGNTGAVYNKDFIELHNRSISPVDLTSWGIYYGSAAGTTWSGMNLSGIIPAGGYMLIGLAGGTNGANLPLTDFIGTINLSVSNGKIALFAGQMNQGACPTGISDLAAYGAVNCWEGSGAAGAVSVTTSIIRNNMACDDTNNNSVDFIVGAPQPRNSLTAPQSCGCL